MAIASTKAELISMMGRMRPATSGFRPTAFMTLLPIRPRLNAGMIVPMAIVIPLTNVGLANGEVEASASIWNILSPFITPYYYYFLSYHRHFCEPEAAIAPGAGW